LVLSWGHGENEISLPRFEIDECVFDDGLKVLVLGRFPELIICNEAQESSSCDYGG